MQRKMENEKLRKSVVSARGKERDEMSGKLISLLLNKFNLERIERSKGKKESEEENSDRK
jgi:hypothetical protein